MKRNRKTVKEIFKEKNGFGTVEVILILVIIIGLVIIFKEQITEIVESIFETITSGVSEVTA